MAFLDYCLKHRIYIAKFPPYLTHQLQPLDVSLFRLLATYYSAELNKWIIKHHGLIYFSKRDFYPCFKKAWQAAFKELNIQSSWTKTGLNPFNPFIVLNKLH
ncbi:hypothetical protein EV356DRAFT_554103 [Viridothelium virens]|uniref:DDE-1 domain-containing protein n=1 Tax=Viridothelium virens TaxID=1048519 RepID=A0A6A6GRF3_VIRVR|nr:hypothetical protein EV356DRAFT_554103 [Viridothelium virens]